MLDFIAPVCYNIIIVTTGVITNMSDIVWKDEVENLKVLLKTKTIDQIGRDYGVTKQRIYQVMQKFGLETELRKRKSFLKGKTPKQYWLNHMLVRKGVPKEDRLTLLETLEVPDECPMLGIPLNYEGGYGGGWQGRTDNSPSIDQIVPSKGYTLDNIQVISWRANRIKNDATPEELVKISQFMKKLL